MYNKYKEEHAFKTLQKDLKSGELTRVVLLCGKEQFLIEWGRNQIIGKYVEQASKVLDLTMIDEQESMRELSQGSSYGPNSITDYIIENCETLPLLSKKKVVVVRDTKLLNSSEKHGGKNSELSRLCDYLPKIPESTILVFISSSVDKKKKLPKAIAKNGKIYDFDQLDRKELISFADKRFRTGGVSVSSRTMDFLINETGYYNKESDYDLFTFSNDIVKMIALSENGVLTEQIVKDTVEKDIETFIFSLMNSISEGRKDKAFELLHNIVSESVDVSGLTAMIVGQFEIMYSIKELLEARIPDRMIIEKLDMNEYRFKVLKPFVSKYSKERLKDALKLSYEIDKNIKMGLLKPSLALEMFVARI